MEAMASQATKKSIVIRVGVSTPNGEMYKIQLDTDASVMQLRERILFWSGIKPQWQSLYFNGYLIDDDTANVSDLLDEAVPTPPPYLKLFVVFPWIAWPGVLSEKDLDTDREAFVAYKDAEGRLTTSIVPRNTSTTLTLHGRMFVLVYPTARYEPTQPRVYTGECFHCEPGENMLKIDEELDGYNKRLWLQTTVSDKLKKEEPYLTHDFKEDDIESKNFLNRLRNYNNFLHHLTSPIEPAHQLNITTGQQCTVQDKCSDSDTSRHYMTSDKTTDFNVKASSNISKSEDKEATIPFSKYEDKTAPSPESTGTTVRELKTEASTDGTRSNTATIAREFEIESGEVPMAKVATTFSELYKDGSHKLLINGGYRECIERMESKEIKVGRILALVRSFEHYKYREVSDGGKFWSGDAYAVGGRAQYVMQPYLKDQAMRRFNEMGHSAREFAYILHTAVYVGKGCDGKHYVIEGNQEYQEVSKEGPWLKLSDIRSCFNNVPIDNSKFLVIRPYEPHMTAQRAMAAYYHKFEYKYNSYGFNCETFTSVCAWLRLTKDDPIGTAFREMMELRKVREYSLGGALKEKSIYARNLKMLFIRQQPEIHCGLYSLDSDDDGKVCIILKKQR